MKIVKVDAIGYRKPLRFAGGEVRVADHVRGTDTDEKPVVPAAAGFG